MHILAIDESSKKALVRSRRVLGAFLFRKGSGSFAGRLSQEGVDALVKNLKNVASKNTAVALFHIAGKDEITLIARVGQKHMWDDEGNFAYKKRSTPVSVSQKERATPMWRVMRYATRLAALFHDIGKANTLFQNKLRSTTPSSGERLRHELLSCLMFETWVSKNSSSSVDWLSNLVNNTGKLSSMATSTVCADIEESWNDVFSSQVPDRTACVKYSQNLLDKIESARDLKDILASSIAWLVLTHHKAICAADGNGGVLYEASYPYDQIQPGLPQMNMGLDFRSENLTLAPKGLPWDDPAWMDAVRENAKGLLALIADPLFINECAGLTSGDMGWKQNYVFNLAAMARPLMILSDYVGSSLKKEMSKDDFPDMGKDVAFANTIGMSEAQNGEPRVLADTLSSHLLKVRRMVDPFFLLADERGRRLPSMTIATSSPVLTQAAPGSKFAWQDGAVAAVKSMGNPTESPFFAVVISETGAGKTIGGVKIMAAASGETLRYTCALGLRSLTIQTGSAYKKQLGMEPNQCSTMVGDALYARMVDQAAQKVVKIEDSMRMEGSESLEPYDEMEFAEPWEPLDGVGSLGAALRVDMKTLASVFNSKMCQLIETPVVVCTVDHLMKASVLQKGSDAQPLLRLMTSDLILDEIDNYSIEDIKALTRLVYVAGLYRRRVVLMSATVGADAVGALLSAWRQGLSASDMRLGKKAEGCEPYALLVHNQLTPVVEKLSGPLTDSRKLVDDFFLSVAKHLDGRKHRNVMEVIDIDSAKTKQEAFEMIKNKVMEKAKDVAVKLVDGKEIAVIVVKLNKVQQVRQLARYFYALPDADIPKDVNLRIQCYHSHFPMYFLSEIERGLNSLLQRADDPEKESKRLSEHPLVKDWLESSSEGKKRLVCVVCATSIQETGRDHDYDYAITEPRGTRSAAQLAGRVRRHRTFLSPNVPTVGLLSKEFAEISADKPSLVGLEVATAMAPAFWGGGKKDVFARVSNQLNPKDWTPYLDTIAAANKKVVAGQKPTVSLLRGLCASSAAPLSLSRGEWFPSRWFDKDYGISASSSLFPTHENKSHLSTMEHVVQRFNFNFSNVEQIKRIEVYGASVYPAPMLFDANANPRAFKLEWLWGRHAHAVKFRRQTKGSMLLAFWPSSSVNRSENKIGLHELVRAPRGLNKIVREIVFETTMDHAGTDSYTCVANSQRTMFIRHVEALVGNESQKTLASKINGFKVSLEKAWKQIGLPVPNEKAPSLLGLSFAMSTYNEIYTKIYFDVLLGADTSSSDAEA